MSPASDLEQAFLHEILEAPDDDAPRLVFADWLMDQPDPSRAARGEFIRVLARSPHLEHICWLSLDENDLTAEGQSALRQRFGDRVKF